MKFTARQKHLFYEEVAKLLEAGFPIQKALETLADQKFGPAETRYIARVNSGLAEGQSIADAVKSITDPPITEIEKNLIEAGERGGRLADVFSHLSGYFQRMDLTQRSILSHLIYPLVLFHLAAFIRVIPGLFTEESKLRAFRPAILSLLFFYGLIVGLFFLCRWLSRLGTTNVGVDRALRKLPLIGPLRRALGWERFCEVYRIYLLAGLKPSMAVATAGEASRGAELREKSASIGAQLAEGSAIAPLVRDDALFPTEFSRGLATAEAAGTMDKDLERWGRHFRLQAQSSFDRLGTWLPKILYFGVLIYVAWVILSMWMGYFKALGDLKAVGDLMGP